MVAGRVFHYTIISGIHENQCHNDNYPFSLNADRHRVIQPHKHCERKSRKCGNLCISSTAYQKASIMQNLSGFNGLVLAAALSVIPIYQIHAQTAGGEKFDPVFVDSLKCNASGTKGCTVDREISISAGPDRVFIPDSLRFKEASRSGNGKIEYEFREDKYTMVSVPVTVAGVEYKLPMPSKIVIQLHAESGSGAGSYNKGAWLNGYVSGRTIEIER